MADGDFAVADEGDYSVDELFGWKVRIRVKG